MKIRDSIVIAKEEALLEYNIPYNNRVAVRGEYRVEAVDKEWVYSGDINFNLFYSLNDLEKKIDKMETFEKTYEMLLKAVEGLTETNKLLREELERS